MYEIVGFTEMRMREKYSLKWGTQMKSIFNGEVKNGKVILTQSPPR
jgi:hypothetical protein